MKDTKQPAATVSSIAAELNAGLTPILKITLLIVSTSYECFPPLGAQLPVPLSKGEGLSVLFREDIFDPFPKQYSTQTFPALDSMLFELCTRLYAEKSQLGNINK